MYIFFVKPFVCDGRCWRSTVISMAGRGLLSCWEWTWHLWTSVRWLMRKRPNLTTPCSPGTESLHTLTCTDLHLTWLTRKHTSVSSGWPPSTSSTRSGSSELCLQIMYVSTVYICVIFVLAKFILVGLLWLNPVPDFPLPGLVYGNVLARSLQQLFLRLSPAGHRYGCQNAAYHPVFRHTQRQAGTGELFKYRTALMADERV